MAPDKDEFEDMDMGHDPVPVAWAFWLGRASDDAYTPEGCPECINGEG